MLSEDENNDINRDHTTYLVSRMVDEIFEDIILSSGENFRTFINIEYPPNTNDLLYSYSFSILPEDDEFINTTGRLNPYGRSNITEGINSSPYSLFEYSIEDDDISESNFLSTILNTSFINQPLSFERNTNIDLDIETHEYNNDKYSEHTSCCICLDDFEKNELIVELCDRKHIFHSKCIKEWYQYKNECPICRAIIIKKTCNL